MSGFVSVPAADAPPPAPAPALEHDGFFPGIALATVRDALRVPTQVNDPRLSDAIVSAMLTVGVELAGWKADQVAAGSATLAAVSPADLVAGKPRLVRLYERAVTSLAAAELADTHSDISASADGQKRIDDRALGSDEHRRNATHAIRDIVGETRTSVALI